MLLRLNLILACFALSISAWGSALDDYKAGDALYHQGDYAKAVEKYQAAVQANPGMWEAQMGLGNALFHLGKNAEAVKAYDTSLSLHPDNPTLKAFADRIRPKSSFETLAEVKPAPAGSPAGSIAVAPNSTAAPLSKAGGKAPGLFFNLYGGYDYSLLTAINDGVKWRGVAAEFFYSSPTDTFTAGNSGIDTGLEIGLMLDKTSAISLDASFVMGSTIGYTLTDTGTSSEYQKVTPNLLGGTLNYKFLLPMGTGVKLNLGLGVGWYHVMMDYAYHSEDTSIPVSYDESASFSGDAIGGTFSLGTEIDLGGGMAIGVTAKGRWASFNKVTTATVASSIPFSGGPFALTFVDYDSDGHNNLNQDYESNVDGTTQIYAPVDMSGVQGNLSFILYI